MGSGPGFTDYIEFQHSDADDEADEPLIASTSYRLRQDPSEPTWQRAVREFCSVLMAWRGTESARVNHPFSADERRKLNQFESIDYLAPNSAVFRKWLGRQPHRRYWDRWLMMGTIGVVIGLVAYLLYVLINVLSEFKLGGTRWLILRTNMGVAWLFNTSISLALVAAAALVVGWAPAASGSGVPEVMAYLNGILLPRVFNVYTIVGKFVSCGLAVASGLPVGPEGPMIHIGAALGAAISQGHSTTLRFSSNVFKRFRNPKDKRDFVTAGVAVGVATAFNAPIGGLLFAFEEVASFWQHSLGWQIFFACMCGVLTLNLSHSAGKALLHSGSFGWFTQDIVFEAGLEISGHILAVIPAAVVGLVCGLVGIVFTLLNLKVSRLRDLLFTGRSKWHRMAEPCILAVLYATGSMVLPLFFPCSQTQCVTFEGAVYCGLDNATSWLDSNKPPPTQPLAVPLYTCSNHTRDGGNAWIPGSGTITPDSSPANSTSTVFYNGMATLLLNTGDDAIKHLLSRGTHQRFNYGVLLTMLGWYFIGAALAAGSAISSGLFVPMLMMGALLGRLVGLATTDIAERWGQHLSAIVSWQSPKGNPWSWIDPGAFALVGAGAFMSSVTRLTVALAVIMVEISDDVHLLLPVLVAIMVAKWVADAATHSLYHALLELKCVPFLLPEPVSKYSLDLLQVSAVMRKPVVTLKHNMKVGEVQAVLQNTTHNGFPVVADTSVGEIFTGLITRTHLLAVLQHIANQHSGTSNGSSGSARPTTNGGLSNRLLPRQLSWHELNRKMFDPVDVEARHSRPGEQQMVSLSPTFSGELDFLAVPGVQGEVVDLTPYINTSAVAVQETFSVERVYLLFRNLGLRHLVVVDEFNRVKGIITRKDLLGFKLDDAMARAIRKVDSVAELGRQDWTHGRVTGPTRQSSWSAAAPAGELSSSGAAAVLVPLPSGAV